MSDFKYNINDEVRVKSNKVSGVITKQTREKVWKLGKEVVEVKYYITTKYSNSNWHMEDELEHIYTFSDKFNNKLNKLMIDVNLGEKQYHLAKYWADIEV